MGYSGSSQAVVKRGFFLTGVIREGPLWIIAIAHTHRKPDYWIEGKSEVPK